MEYNKDTTEAISNKIDNSKEAVKLDIIMKNLFQASDRMLVNLLNGLFDESFSVDEVEVTLEESEFSRSNEFDIIRADKIISVASKPHNKKHYFNIEFQTLNDSSMAIRMFEYGFSNSIKNLKREKEEKDSNIILIEMPKPLVMFLEKNRNIKDELILRFVFPYREPVDYNVKVIKYWELKQQELIDKKMYVLLPIRLFNLRKALYKIIKLNKEERIIKLEEKKIEAKALARNISEMAKEFFYKQEITDMEFHNIIISVQNLIEYLNRNFINDENLEVEVTKMTKTLYDPLVEEKGRVSGKKEGKIEGKIEDVLDLLQEIGKIPKAIEDTVKNQNDLDVIKKYLKIAAKAESFEEFEQGVKNI